MQTFNLSDAFHIAEPLLSGTNLTAWVMAPMYLGAYAIILLCVELARKKGLIKALLDGLSTIASGIIAYILATPVAKVIYDAFVRGIGGHPRLAQHLRLRHDACGARDL